MFQYFATFLRDASPLSTTSMVSFSCWFIHLAHFAILTCLYLPFRQPCIIVVAR
jgi:hypothetical protein